MTFWNACTNLLRLSHCKFLRGRRFLALPLAPIQPVHWGVMLVLAFESTHAAMAAQKVLAPLQPYVIPTPKEISAGCGMSLRFKSDEVVQLAGGLLQDHPDIVAASSWHYVE